MTARRISKQPLQRVLLVDDEDPQLKLYSHLLSQQLSSEIHTTRFPTQALVLAESKLFDVIIIDVTIDYNGSPFGGLELYKQLIGRYGSNSLLVYSKFITEELLKRYNYPFNFVEIGDDTVAFAYDPIWRVISRAVKSAAFEPVRVDKEPFNSSIVEQIFRELREAKLVLFVTASSNPNVFYEAGFAHALGKEVIVLTDEYSTLPFDVRDRNAIAYGGNLQKLEKLLSSKLRRLS
jgi:CheY-like chemotaxis protein